MPLNLTFLNPSPAIAEKATGGPAIHFQELKKHLEQRGVQIAVMRSQRPNGEYRWFPDTPLGAIRVAQWSDLAYQRFRATSSRPGSYSRSLSWLKRFYRLPIVWEINAPVFEGVILGKYNTEECERRTAIAVRAASSVELAFCVSREIEDYAQSVLKIKNTVYVPNGSDCELFSPDTSPTPSLPKKEKETRIFWMGSGVLPWEGNQMILELANNLNAVDRTLHFVLAGGGQDENIKLPPNVTHLGKVPHNQLPGYLSSADICLCLYELSAYLDYGFYNSPLKLYEYMAAGKPVIATDAGEISRTMTHGQDGWLVGSDLGEIQNAILKLANDAQLRGHLGKHARTSAEEFYNWDRAAKQTVDALYQLCGRTVGQ